MSEHPYPLLQKLDDFVYKTEFHGKPVIIKIREPLKSNAIYFETLILKNYFNNEFGFPKLLEVGKQYEYMILGLLGPNLEQLLKEVGGKMPWDIVRTIGLQVLDRLKTMHMKGFVHGDIKPTNLLIDIEDRNAVFLIDFQTASRYNSSNRVGMLHGQIGTPRFASQYISKGNVNYLPWDDLQSLGYVMLYLLQGQLPWQGLNFNTKNIWKVISKIKNDIPSHTLTLTSPMLLPYFTQLDTWAKEKHWVLTEEDYEKLKFALYKY